MSSVQSSIPEVEHLHAADTPELVRAPATTFVSIGGSGRPGTDASYRKKRLATHIARAIPGDHDPTVVELLYWFPEGARPVEIADFYWVNPIDDLRYRVLVRVPRDTGPGLVLAAERTWDIDGDSAAELRHKLAECLWWTFVLADRLDVDLTTAYGATMDKIERGLSDAVERG